MRHGYLSSTGFGIFKAAVSSFMNSCQIIVSTIDTIYCPIYNTVSIVTLSTVLSTVSIDTVSAVLLDTVSAVLSTVSMYWQCIYFRPPMYKPICFTTQREFMSLAYIFSIYTK